MDIKAHDIARHYITYRYIQSLKRQTNTTDERILSLIECQNEEVKQENANKNPTVNSVQRDYMAGEISKDLTARLLLDPEIVKAHQEGLIHFHDSDYFAQHMHNCDLVNLDDMLQNGTVISGTYIEKPHSFSTACNIATQIIAQVASNQYGGQSISLTHLAPFVDVSRKKIAAEVEAEMRSGDKANLEAEFGDLFFALVNAARLYGVDPESALERTNKKFIRRFNYMEEQAAAQGNSLHDLSLGQMEALWQEAKKGE